MKQFRRHAPLLLLALTIACAGATDVKPSQLDGTWIAPAENASPSGWYQRSLTFGSNGSFVSEFRSYGIYQGQSRNELSGFSRTEGRYQVDGDRLLFQPARLISWDRFYGVNSPVQVMEPYPYGSIFDDARFAIEGGILILHYTIYPADAAEPAVLTFSPAR
jgi:hypothetical protein